MQFLNIDTITQGYGFVTFSIAQGVYYALRGDSGAVAGGSVFGDGVRKGSANNNGDSILDPETAGSFAHPIGVNALPNCIVDTTIPTVFIEYICDGWSVTTSDVGDDATGIYDISLAENSMPDSSYNVEFYPNLPVFTYGASTVGPFTIKVGYPEQPAQAALHIRNEVGNEFDTILTFLPTLLSTPSDLNVGRMSDLVHKDTFTVVTNVDSIRPVVIDTAKLYNNICWKIIPPYEKYPDTLAPLASDTIHLKYTAPNNPQSEIDIDSVMLTICDEFSYVTVVGESTPVDFTATSYNFGCLTIDTLAHGGDTATTTNKQIYVTNTGIDTLHIFGWELTGVNIGFAEADSVFAILSPPMPVDSAHAYALLPDSSLLFIIRAHPIHSYPQYDTATLVYLNDAGSELMDTSYLTVCAEAPSAIPQSQNRGSALDATIISQNSPNPFSDGTDIQVTLPMDSYARLTIINAMGVVVTTPLEQEEPQGTFTVHVDATNLPSGFYYYRLQTKLGTYLRTMAIMK